MGSDKIVAAVLFERMPIVIPKIDPAVYAFQEFSLRWKQQYSRRYPNEVLGKSNVRGRDDYRMDFVPAPRITEADKNNDKISLQRVLDRRLYLLIYDSTNGAAGKYPIWHFPEKVYEKEETLRLCAELALKYVISGLHHTYFIGNAPMGYIVSGPTEDSPDTPSQIQMIKQAYWAKFHAHVEHEIGYHATGDHKKILLAYVGKPCYEGLEVDPATVAHDAKHLFKAGEKRVGTDEETFVCILVKGAKHIMKSGCTICDFSREVCDKDEFEETTF